jgi:hypothetical protein
MNLNRTIYDEISQANFPRYANAVLCLTPLLFTNSTDLDPYRNYYHTYTAYHCLDPPSSTANATASLENSSMCSKLNSGLMSITLTGVAQRYHSDRQFKCHLLVRAMDVLVGVFKRGFCVRSRFSGAVLDK